jgi:hypothetical protein
MASARRMTSWISSGVALGFMTTIIGTPPCCVIFRCFSVFGLWFDQA